MEEDPQLCIEDMLAHPMEGRSPCVSGADTIPHKCEPSGQWATVSSLCPEPAFRKSLLILIPSGQPFFSFSLL